MSNMDDLLTKVLLEQVKNDPVLIPNIANKEIIQNIRGLAVLSDNKEWFSVTMSQENKTLYFSFGTDIEGLGDVGEQLDTFAGSPSSFEKSAIEDFNKLAPEVKEKFTLQSDGELINLADYEVGNIKLDGTQVTTSPTEQRFYPKRIVGQITGEQGCSIESDKS